MTHELLAGYPVVVEQAVVWGDMDSYRHVNNVVYFRYFENARLEFSVSWTGRKALEARRLASGRSCTRRRPGSKIAVDVSRHHRHRSWARRLHSGGPLHLAAPHWSAPPASVPWRQRVKGWIVTFHYERGEKVPIPDELRRRIEELNRQDAAAAKEDQEKI